MRVSLRKVANSVKRRTIICPGQCVEVHIGPDDDGGIEQHIDTMDLNATSVNQFVEMWGYSMGDVPVDSSGRYVGIVPEDGALLIEVQE